MKNILLFLGVLLCLFITTSTASYIGITSVGLSSYGLLIVLFFYSLFFDYKYFKRRNFKIESTIMILFILFGIIKISMEDYDSLQSAFFFLAVPMMISMLIQIQSIQTKQKIAYIILLFFILECLLAIYERIKFTNIFDDYTTDITALSFEEWTFRSTSFLGFPLNNAFCVSTIMGSILISKVTERVKLIFVGVGLLSILCFNARAATIIMCFVILYYLFLSYKKYGHKNYYKVLLILISLIGIYSFYYLITETSFGGRLTNYDKVIDGSAQARLEVFAAFDYFSGYDFLFGNQSLYLPIMNKLGQGGIENGYIVIILRYGIIFGLPIIILLILYFFQRLKNFTFPNKIIMFCSFLIIGSSNNGLADITPWVIFILSINTLPYINYGFKENIGLNKIALKNYK